MYPIFTSGLLLLLCKKIKIYDLYSKQWKVPLTTSTVISSISFTTFTIPDNSHIIANHSIGIPYLALESQTIVYNIVARAWTFGTYSTAI